MRELTIYRRYFNNADCYTKGTKQKNTGVQIHSTGANNPYLHRYVGPDDGRLGPNKYNNTHNRPGLSVCASAYIGKLADGTVAVYQALPWDYRCWLSGSADKGNANRLGYAGFEICEDNLKDEEYFRKAVMEVSVSLTAHLCTLFGVGIDRVRDHNELHTMGIASNHGDITQWLKRYGLTMDDYRAEVLAALNEGLHITYIDCDANSGTETHTASETPLYTATVTSTGTYLNLRKAKSKSSNSLKKLYRGTTVEVLDDSDPVWWTIRSGSITGYAMAVDTDTGAQWLTCPDVKPGTFTVVIPGLDAATATTLLDTYPGAYSIDS